MASSENESELFIQEENVLRNANRYDDSFVPWRESSSSAISFKLFTKVKFWLHCDNFTRDINKFVSPFPFLWLPFQWMTVRERARARKMKYLSSLTFWLRLWLVNYSFNRSFCFVFCGRNLKSHCRKSNCKSSLCNGKKMGWSISTYLCLFKFFQRTAVLNFLLF
jgi:hypothetical protein